jgi:hypothetical protein
MTLVGIAQVFQQVFQASDRGPKGPAVGRMAGIGALRGLAAGLALLAVAGCADLPGAGQSGTPEATVKARAQARWDAVVKGDIKAAYAYLSPGSRAVLSEDDYEHEVRRGFWKSAKVQGVTCSNSESCKVEVAIEYRFRGSPITTPASETWVKQDSGWWLVR